MCRYTLVCPTCDSHKINDIMVINNLLTAYSEDLFDTHLRKHQQKKLFLIE